ncbi:MAG: DUF448 domain-containing protein [Actinobacteria bacterium]|nr:DUF448 domain-containing protein [Actinomycetota bacterium]
MKPVRTCIACRSRADKDSLVRFVERDGSLVWDASANQSGRGAWVHPTSQCFDSAVSRKAFGRALRTQITNTAIARESIEHQLVQTAPDSPSDKG